MTQSKAKTTLTQALDAAQAHLTAGTCPTGSDVSVQVIAGQPMTTSLDVAQHFGKMHKNVIKAIKALECTDSFHKLNFEPIQIDVDLGMGRTRKDPAYRMTRDGFTFLCMGFTGKEAARWKEAYINAFNRMEQALRQPAPQALPDVDRRAQLTFAIKTLDLMRDGLPGHPPKPPTDQLVRHFLAVETLEQASEEQIRMALSFIQGQIIGEGSAGRSLPGVAGTTLGKRLLYELLESAHDAESMFAAMYDAGVEKLASEAFRDHLAGKLADTSRGARDLLGYVSSFASRDPYHVKRPRQNTH
ncbi:Rha family transcriptional regulator [Pseudomonas oryzihabitans]|uniref:Rha family transcriptional regulator n=1 Tax=Pseudomonas oryzihabitans TaxID=47885 RepID=UPI00289527FA|nr:Rha family transcriptional regulator [Pseudomonas oryzihabitans]MDT3722958.1 Rha family transcriptional regulator [Pseudomonas oryzihabitans]